MRVNLILTLLIGSLFSDEEMAKADPLAQVVAASPSPSPKTQDGYTINYNTVSIIEYLRFASKICKVNFIYDETDLNFTVTIVSDEPVTPGNVMATLVQVLRVHGILLLEQDNNLVLHKSAEVKQAAKLVTDSEQEGTAAIVTRIFRIKNAKPSSIAAIIQPMISSSALLETSAETRQLILTDVRANVDKIATLIENLDSPHTLLEIKSFSVQHNKPDFLIELGSQIMGPITQGNPFILVPQNLANEIYIVSTPELVQKALSVFKSLDTVPKVDVSNIKPRAENIYVYKVVNRSGNDVLKALTSLAQNLQNSGVADPDLLQTIDTARWIPETNSIMLIGTKNSLDKTKEFLMALDSGNGGKGEASFFIYKPQSRSAEDIEKSILEMAHNLKGTRGADPNLIETIESVKLNPLTHTLSFSGEERTFERIKQLLATIDSSSGKSGNTAVLPSTQFYIYKPVHQTGEELEKSLKEVTAQLKTDQLADPSLLHSLETMKWVKSTHSLMFTGDPASLTKVQTLISTVDVPATKSEKTFFQYHPRYASAEKTENYLKEISLNLSKKGGSGALVETLRSYKWIPDSQTFMFYGTQSDLAQVKEILATFDTPAVEAKPTYYIYKVQHTSGDIIEDELDLLAKNFKSSGLKDAKILDVIAKIRYVKQTNSLLLSGDPQAVEEVKQLIAQYDYPRTAGPASSNFYMYKPQHLQAAQIEKSLKEVGTNLKNAGLADPSLLKAIETVKYVEATNSLIFTGSPDTLQKIQGLIKDIDIAPTNHAPIQRVGKNTFLLYKLKNATGPQIVTSLKNMTAELKKTGSDKDFLAALNSIKYVKETNSLLFTGNEESLTKVQALVEKFDVSSLSSKSDMPASSGASNFFVYKPQSLSGPDMEKILSDFAENLSSSGLNDPDLFAAIKSMRWTDKTQTFVFTGTPKALDQIKDLLKQFDIPSNMPGGPSITGPLEPSIQAIDNTSFLVYKLQFHKGDEIQGALRQIAKDLIISNAPVNQGLLNSINSIQWLEVTNSLLCSGDQETLTRLRELIKNLDVPLKQVFIEMLMIETTLANALTFGLEWGANFKYRDKFSSNSYNTPPNLLPNGTPDQFIQNLSNVNTTTTPVPTQIPAPASGFDLGVIGEVIRHNGQSFLTLGSLLSALQTDDETSIIMTPKIITQDGRTSTLFRGENIPFVGSFISNSGSNTINTSNIEYRDIGVNLTITPVLGNSDIVTLDISLDRSQTVGDINQATLQPGAQSANGIITSKTTMQTTVHVPDNNFLVLTGMVNNSNVKSKAGVPCLGGLPLVGALFSKSGDSITNSNIVIFIRPHIINSVDDMRKISTKEEEYFRDQVGTPFLEKNFDEAMELIKTVDDE